MTDAKRNATREADRRRERPADDASDDVGDVNGSLARFTAGREPGGVVRGRRRPFQRAAVLLAGLGGLALLGAFVRPGAQSILFALAGVGLFGAVVTRYVTPSRFVTPEAGESAYAAFAATVEELRDEFDLGDRLVYVPTSDGDGRTEVRAFVPASDDGVPDADEVTELFVDSGNGRTNGIAVPSSGVGLYRSFQRTVRVDRSGRPERLGETLVDALANEFELVQRASVAAEPGRLTASLGEGAYGPLDRFDHPAVSFVAVGLAATLDVPVRVDVAPGDERATFVVTCEWDEERVTEE